MMRRSSLLAESLAIVCKELASELRQRVALSAIGLFAITTLIAVAYQIGPYSLAENDRPFLLSALLWIILFFASMAGLARVFVKEEDAHTAKTLRLAARPHAVLLGKLVFNLLLLLALEVVVVPLYCGLMGLRIEGVLGLVLVMLAGGATLSISATFVAALIARASGSNTLFPILALPLLLPLLVAAFAGTRAAVGSPELGAVLPALRAISSLGGVTMVTALLLFPVVWRD